MFPVVADDHGMLFQWTPAHLQDIVFKPNDCGLYYGDYMTKLRKLYEDDEVVW